MKIESNSLIFFIKNEVHVFFSKSITSPECMTEHQKELFSKNNSLLICDSKYSENDLSFQKVVANLPNGWKFLRQKLESAQHLRFKSVLIEDSEGELIHIRDDEYQESVSYARFHKMLKITNKYKNAKEYRESKLLIF